VLQDFPTSVCRGSKTGFVPARGLVAFASHLLVGFRALEFLCRIIGIFVPAIKHPENSWLFALVLIMKKAVEMVLSSLSENVALCPVIGVCHE
jgi:hypothetical protein